MCFRRSAFGEGRIMKNQVNSIKWPFRRFFIWLFILCCTLFVFTIYYSLPLTKIYHLCNSYNLCNIEFEQRSLLVAKFDGKYKRKLNETELPSSDNWIRIDEDIYIYSAYWESRIKPYFVRIVGIGLLKGQDNSHIVCVFKYNHTHVKTTAVKTTVIPENHNMKHTAMFYLCHVDQVPLEVTLSLRNQMNLSWIKVNKIEPVSTSSRRLAVCVQPLYGIFPDNNLHVAEFISYYQLLNVTHFTFYDYKAQSTLKSLLKEISKNGTSIDLLRWDLPEAVKDTWIFAQMASIVDCMYRLSHSYEYVAVVDIDEYLVPHNNVTIQNLIEDIDNRTGAKWGSYMFRQSFFCLNLSDDPDFNKTNIPLFTLKKVFHAKKIWDYYYRTKTILRPSYIEVPGIHFIWKPLKNRKNKSVMTVDSNVAYLHHYRRIYQMECNDSTIDRTAVTYGHSIVNSVPIQVWKRMSKAALKTLLTNR